jgi:hypothetical protein
VTGTPEVVDGPVAGRLDGAVAAGPLACAVSGRLLFSLPGVGRFLAEGGRVTVERAATATPHDVACLLAGPLRQAVWLQRGRFALRGCGVVLNGRAIVLTGAGAAGKSAVAAELVRRGHRLLADGAVPIRIDDPPVAEPADGAVQLWPDVAALLGLDPEAGTVIRPRLAKRSYRCPVAGATPLAAVVVLNRRGEVGPPAVRSVVGLEAAMTIIDHTALRPAVAPLGLGTAHFRWATAVAFGARVAHLRSDRHRHDLVAVAEAVEAVGIAAGPARD